ncbi:MAG TPA: AMP-binding protein [Acidimicrobiales bacterium]|nr:AMP-binding protein [Acidimicrobiales bacterium]
MPPDTDPTRASARTGAPPPNPARLPTRHHKVIHTSATMFSGVWLVPVNTHLTGDEVAYILGDAGVNAVFADPDHADLARASTAAPVVGIGDELDRLAASAVDTPFDLSGPTGGRMHYTSGTTGRPKGVKRALPPTIDGYLDLLARLGRSMGLDGSGPHLMTGPHYHAAVSGYALYDLVNGGSVVMMPRFDASTVLRLIDERAITHTHLVPTMFVRLLRLPEAERRAFDPSPLSMVLHGAAPISPTTKRSMIDWWGPRLVEYWGSSEGGTFTLIDSHEWLARPGSVGRALPGVDVFAVDDDGRRLAAGEVGTLYCRAGDAERPFRYHHAPEKTEASYLAPATFTMGDMGHVDADGYVFLTDRATNMIISGGVNIYPAEVEHVLSDHPAVVDVAVFGVPDEEWGESVKAAVELRPGVAPSAELAAELIAFARERLASYKVPRTIDFEERLPRLDTGKILTRQLREPYWRDRDRPI